MIIINLITGQNSLYKKFFEEKGLDTTEYSPLMHDEDLQRSIKKGRRNYTILEIKDGDCSEIEKNCRRMKFLYGGSKLVCLTEKITPSIKKCLITTGVTDCLISPKPERVAEYIETLEYKTLNKFGKFLILDDNEIHRNMLKGVIQRFGYKTEFITAKEELFDKINDDSIYMILINLACKNLDLNSIIRRSYASSDIKKFPILTYKDMDEGLFVHEIINGLNKLTKVILSPQELYNMMIDLLFKKDIMTDASSFNKYLEFEKYESYSQESISQIYYRIHRNLCSQPSLFTDNHMEDLLKIVDKLKNTLIRIDGIRWLKEAPSAVKKTTCGAGV